MTDQELIIWTAGFFDGEGHLYVKLRCGSVTVEIAQNDVTPLENIQEFFGGSIGTKTNRISSVWILSGSEALNFLESIYPFLLTKNEETKLVLDNKHLWPGDYKRKSPAVKAARTRIHYSLMDIRTDKKISKVHEKVQQRNHELEVAVGF